MPKIRIRNLMQVDAEELSDIFHRAVHEIAIRDYTQEQVSAWSPAPMGGEAYLRRIAGGHYVLVAANADDKPVGFIELENDGHIDCFYCDPIVAGTGVGSALYRQLEQKACERGMAQLFVEASEPAKRFLLRAGFDIDHRREIVRRGVTLHNYRMTKLLSRNAEE